MNRLRSDQSTLDTIQMYVRIFSLAHMGVFKNRGTPKWMVKIMENPIKMDDLGGFNPLFSETPICVT